MKCNSILCNKLNSVWLLTVMHCHVTPQRGQPPHLPKPNCQLQDDRLPRSVKNVPLSSFLNCISFTLEEMLPRRWFLFSTSSIFQPSHFYLSTIFDWELKFHALGFRKGPRIAHIWESGSFCITVRRVCVSVYIINALGAANSKDEIQSISPVKHWNAHSLLKEWTLFFQTSTRWKSCFHFLNII